MSGFCGVVMVVFCAALMVELGRVGMFDSYGAGKADFERCEVFDFYEAGKADFWGVGAPDFSGAGMSDPGASETRGFWFVTPDFWEVGIFEFGGAASEVCEVATEFYGVETFESCGFEVFEVCGAATPEFYEAAIHATLYFEGWYSGSDQSVLSAPCTWYQRRG